ncbi:MAG: endolytic transglycosylase MltG [Lachnospiraceae bacterium]|nr:endolytic transglycosylase MltG [Lachnospiraceae bacterium]
MEKKRKNSINKEAKEQNNKSLYVRLGIIAAFVVVAIIICTMAFKLGYGLFQNDAMEEAPGTQVLVTIPEKASKSEVAELLKYNGLIDDESMFKLRCIVYDAKFNAGTYTLNTSMTTEEILDELRFPVVEEEETTTAAPAEGEGEEAAQE